MLPLPFTKIRPRTPRRCRCPAPHRLRRWFSCPLHKDGKPYKVPYYEVQVPYYPTMEDRKWAAERLAERGWGKPKQDVVIDDHETIGFQIVFRQWPQGYDPLAKGEKPYQPRPDDREAHGKLALPPLKDPTPHKDGDGNGSH